MLGFPFPKEWFYPDLALAQRFLIRLGRMVSADTVEVRLIEAPANDPALVALCTLRFERTGITSSASA
jgi:hypothetical protein